jgi:Na+/proline symporter
VAGFLGYAAWAGLRARAQASADLDQYFLAGRSLPGWKAGISMAATQFAADTPLLVTGLIAVAGVFALWRLWIYGLAFLLMGFVLGAAWRRAGVFTDAELAERRYAGRAAAVLRVAKALYFGIAFNCTVMAMVLLAATRIAEPFLSWDQWLPAGLFEPLVRLVEWSGVRLTVGTAGDPAWAAKSASNLVSLLVIVGVTTLYSTTGGLRAVVNTDLVQFAIAMVATLVYAGVVARQAGGLFAIPARLRELYGPADVDRLLALTPGHAEAGLVVIGTIAIQWLAQMNADGTGYLAQRTMACRSDRDARQAAVVFVVAQVLLRTLLWVPIGLGLLILVPAAGLFDPSQATAREATFVTGIRVWLPAGALGLMLTGMLAALASTIDSHLNWGASYCTNDLYRRVVCEGWLRRPPTGRELVWVARSSNLLILGIAVAILTQLDSIQAAWTTSLLLGAGMGLPLVLRWLWWRVTAWAELLALLASSLAAPLLLHFVEVEGLRLLLMATLSGGVLAAVSVLGPPEPEQKLREFYRQVRPPGFWGPVALREGVDPGASLRLLGRGLALTVGGAAAVFCTLVAVLTWMFDAPAPSWSPGRTAWLAMLGAAALVLLPLLWRMWRQLEASEGGRATAPPSGR